MSRELRPAPLARCAARLARPAPPPSAPSPAGSLPDLLAARDGRRRGLAGRRFDEVLVWLCEAALLGSGAWLWVVTGLVARDAARGRDRVPGAASRRRSAGWCWSPAARRSPAAWPRRRTPLPRRDRAPRTHARPRPGLPLPDRATATMHVGHLVARRAARSAGPGPGAAPRTVVVRPGDTLWGLADATLAPGASARRGRRPVAADLPRQPRRHRRRPRPDPARPATAPPPALRGVPMSPFHEKVVPLRPPVPVGSIQGTLALDLHPRHDPPEPRSRSGRSGADVVPIDRSVRAGSSSGHTATRRRPSRSSVATGRSASCCGGRRRTSTTTSPAAPSWSRAPSAAARPAGSSRSARRCSASTPASSPATPPRSARTSATASAPGPWRSASSCAASDGSASPWSLPSTKRER